MSLSDEVYVQEVVTFCLDESASQKSILNQPIGNPFDKIIVAKTSLEVRNYSMLLIDE